MMLAMQFRCLVTRTSHEEFENLSACYHRGNRSLVSLYPASHLACPSPDRRRPTGLGQLRFASSRMDERGKEIFMMISKCHRKSGRRAG
jgi:hypothetical protein